MSKITNDCLTQSGTGCLIAVPIWQQWTSKRSDKIMCVVFTVPETRWQDGDSVQPTSSYRRNEQTVNEDDGRTQRHTVEEQETKTYSSGDTGSLTRTTTTARRQTTSYSHTGDPRHQPQRETVVFKDNIIFGRVSRSLAFLEC